LVVYQPSHEPAAARLRLEVVGADWFQRAVMASPISSSLTSAQLPARVEVVGEAVQASVAVGVG
jgi:hypothetical protein